jgi:hypothetical protein
MRQVGSKHYRVAKVYKLRNVAGGYVGPEAGRAIAMTGHSPKIVPLNEVTLLGVTAPRVQVKLPTGDYAQYHRAGQTNAYVLGQVIKKVRGQAKVKNVPVVKASVLTQTHGERRCVKNRVGNSTEKTS